VAFEPITSVQEFNPGQGQVIWTSYAYDALSQIAQVIEGLTL
jgi:hypothetical protein